MKRNSFIRGSLMIAVLFAIATLGLAEPAGVVIPGRYIVHLKKDAVPTRVIAAHGVAPTYVYTSAVKGFAGAIPPGQLRTLQADPAVLSIVPDRVMNAIGTVVVEGKPAKPTPTPTPLPGQVVPAGVARIGADPASGNALTGAGVGVAVVDTGLDFAHRDLTVSGQTFSVYGAVGQDDNGHGTHVGGIIAAINNTVDVVGVAPAATLYAVKVLNGQGSGYDSDILAGLNWIHANAATVSPKIKVVNMSLGRPGSVDDDPPLRAAVQSLTADGIAVVVAAGNDPKLEVSQQVPATYPEVMAIASTTAKNGASQYRYYLSGIQADTASYFTSDGKFNVATGIGVTVSAPGEDQENINKAGFIQSVGILSTKLGGGTTRMSGTSMAAPHVCGVLARYFQQYPAAGVETARGALTYNASRAGTAPLNSPTSSYTFDGEREGIAYVPDQWSPVPTP